MSEEKEIRVDLEYRPRAWQIECHKSLKRFSVLVCHRRAGKTVMAVLTLLDAANRTKKERARFSYLAPFLKQAKAVAWDYLKHYANKIPHTTINESELWVEFANGARIRIYGADNPDAMRGVYFDGIVLDEVADMKPEVWGEIVRPALADRKGWALFIGTPKGVNLFSELYHSALHDPDWFARSYTVDDTGCLDAEELELARRSMSENQYRQEFMCDFSASVDNQLMTIDMVQAACGKHLTEDVYEHAPKILGVDVARYGGDRSVLFMRQGLAAFKPQVYADIDNMTLAGKVAECIQAWQPDAVFIDAGRGEGVIDRLRQLGHAITPVDFGGKPNKVTFVNKRGEMWWELAEWLKAGGALPNMPELKADLCGPTYSYANAAGKFQLESKDDMRKRGLPSPDLADALAVTFAFPVVPTRGPGAHLHAGSGRAVFEYDPFA